MGLFPNRILDDFSISPNLVPLDQMKQPMIFLEEDKAIEVRSDIISTRLVFLI